MLKVYIANIKDLDNDQLFEFFMQSADICRKNKIDSLKFDDDKKRSLAAFILLRHALKVEGYSTNKLSLEYGEYGKPYLTDNSFYFNLSHSGNYVTCAISDQEVGVDIEKTRDVDLKLAELYFSSEENHAIKQSKNEVETFYRLWTLKESFIKNIGLGLKLPLKDFSIKLEKPISINQSYDRKSYYFTEFDIEVGYFTSVCSLTDERPDLIKTKLDKFIEL